MSVELFLNAVLPTSGLRFALASFGVQGAPDFRPGQKPFPAGDTTEIVKYLNWGASRGANAYFAVGGYAEIISPTTGLPQRLATAAVLHRCLRLDIDCGPGKDYADKRDALVDLLAMVAHYGMPTPWIVDSGGGVHVYWGFDQDLPLEQWLPLASRLRVGCETFGLKCDTTTTTDAARILRLPGTPNNKPGRGAPPVRILQAGTQADPASIVAAMPQPLPGATLQLPSAMRGLGDEMSANMHEPYFMAAAVQQCPGLQAMVSTRGQYAAEPQWKAALDLINKADDTEADKHQMARAVSDGHPGFTEEGFVSKWQQVLQQDYHPPTCSRFAATGMRECAACPMRGKISSPLVLGRRVYTPPSDAAVPPMPAQVPDPPVALMPTAAPTSTGIALAPVAPTQVGVFIMDHTTVVRLADGKLTSKLMIVDGYPTQVVESPPDDQGVKKLHNRKMIDHRLLSVERMLDHVGNRSVVVLTFERGLDGTVGVEFDNGDFADPRSFYKKMNGVGLYPNRKSVVDFLDKFMAEFLTQLQRARAASQISGRCGWTTDLTGFVLGTQLYRHNTPAEHIRTSIAPGEMEGYHSTGDELAWRTAFDIVISGGVDRQCVLGLAIAGPLMVFTGLDGVLLNAHSPESGVGKSTLCDAALSIWGSPNVLRKDFRDTANATFKLASVMGNMPMVIDEFTNVEGKALSDYIYTLTQGREKHRMGSDAQLNLNAQRWCLAAIATANNSVHDKLQAYRADSTAEAARVFEMRLFPLNVDPAQMGRIKDQLQALRSSYGFLGPRLVELFMSKPPQFWRDTVMQRIAKYDRVASQSAGDRFRSATCALIEIGASLGAALGFGFQTDKVEAELMRHWTKQVNEFEAERKGPIDFLNSYVLQHLSEMAIIGGAQGNMLLNASLPRRFMGEVRGVTKDNKYAPATVMVPLDYLREYVRDLGGNYKAVLEYLGTSTMVTRLGRLKYLEGTPQQMTTQAVEFHHADVVGTPKLQLVDAAAPIAGEMQA